MPEGPRRAGKEAVLEREHAVAHFREICGIGTRLLPVAFIAVLIPAVIVAARHHLSPLGRRWQDEEELSWLRAFLFGGAAAGIFSILLNSTR